MRERGPHRDARVRVHRRVPRARPALRAGRPGRGQLRRRARPADGLRRHASGAGRSTRSTPSARTPRSTSSSSRCRTTSTSRPSRRGRERQGRGLHQAARAERRPRPAEMLRLVEDGRRLPRLPRERRLHTARRADARDDRGRRDRPADDVPGARRPQRPACRRTSGTPSSPAAARSWTWPRTARRPPATCSARTCRSATCSPGARPSSTATRRPARTTRSCSSGSTTTGSRRWMSRGRPRAASRAASRRTATPDGSSRTSRRRPLRAFIERPAGYIGEKADADTGWVFPVPDEPYAHGHDAMMRHVVEAFRDGVAPRETFRDGFVVNSIIDAAYRSIRSGTWEAVERPTPVGQRPETARRSRACPGSTRPSGSSTASRRRMPAPSSRPASGAPRRSPRTAWSTCSARATRGSRSRRCSRATAPTRGSTRSPSCR